MPIVPGGDAAHDPFGTKAKGKDQDRVPSGPPTTPQDPPSKDFMLMAAASMKDAGRLYAPPATPVPPILASARAEYWAAAEGDK